MSFPDLPPRLPENLPSLPSSAVPSPSISCATSSSEEELKLQPQDPPSLYQQLNGRSSYSRSPSEDSASNLLATIQSSQQDLKTSLHMIESIMLRTSKVQSMCKALKKSSRKEEGGGQSETSRKRESSDSPSPSPDVIDQINASVFQREPLLSRPQIKHTASVETAVYSLLSEMRVLIREFQFQRRREKGFDALPQDSKYETTQPSMSTIFDKISREETDAAVTEASSPLGGRGKPSSSAVLNDSVRLNPNSSSPPPPLPTLQPISPPVSSRSKSKTSSAPKVISSESKMEKKVNIVQPLPLPSFPHTQPAVKERSAYNPLHYTSVDTGTSFELSSYHQNNSFAVVS